MMLKERLGKGATSPVEAFKQHGEDFVVASSLEDLVAGMNKIARGGRVLDAAELRRQIEDRDRQLDNPFGKDAR